MPAGFTESEAEEAGLAWLESPSYVEQPETRSRRRLFMHLDRDSITERPQRCLQAGQLAGGPRIDETRRLAVVDVEAAGEIGNRHLAGAQRAVERRLQRHRRIGRDQVLPAAQPA